MKTLSTPLANQSTAAQAGWCELYDFYLPSAIVTPFGTTATLRITNYPGGYTFFTPKVSPEPVGTQGNAQAYLFWPIGRQTINGSSKSKNDKLTITASNVTADWATMLGEVDWDAVNVIVRKVSTTITGATADDCTVIFSGTIDSAKVTLKQLQFTVSNDLGTFQMSAPRENMHAACRFRWADDQCTQIRFSPANYKSKTCGSSSTTTNVKSSGLTEDSGAKGSYGTDLVAALPDASITASSQQSAATARAVNWPGPDPDGKYTYFRFAGGGGAAEPVLAVNQAIQFSVSPPSPIVVGTIYYITSITLAYGPRAYSFSTTPGGANVRPTATGGSVRTSFDYFAPFVKAGSASYWAMNGSTDWGTLTQGYWQIPDAQAGIRNAALTPYIQFDFGTARQINIWQLTGANTGDRQDCVRMVQFFSSSDASTWKFESYFEVPPIPGGVFDALMPSASSARYWRICIRSRWSSDVRTPMLETVSAFTGSRHYWASGRITFSATTATVALQNISRAVLESYSGELICAPLPAAPASGDVFIIERGCSRTFNACCARANTENFGGFNTLPYVQMTVNP